MKPRHRSQPIEDVFWSRVDRRGPTECWPWMAGRFPFGHGAFSIGGKPRKASRVAWTLTHGAIPAGLLVRHMCHNPPCCNPAHLALGTHADNMRDMTDAGRRPAGERHGMAKLTLAQVRDVRAKHAAGVKNKAIAKEYGVDPSTIGLIVRGEHWRDDNERKLNAIRREQQRRA
jgi:hypothetical protein